MSEETESFQDRVHPWMLECFGETVTYDMTERLLRFTEEALELAQSLGLSRQQAEDMVKYVYNRPKGEPYQEVGGVQVTLAALCNAAELRIVECSEIELARIWTKVPQIREKQRQKPDVQKRHFEKHFSKALSKSNSPSS